MPHNLGKAEILAWEWCQKLLHWFRSGYSRSATLWGLTKRGSQSTKYKVPVIYLGLPWRDSTARGQKAKKCRKENSGNLLKHWGHGHGYPRKTVHNCCTMAQQSLPTNGLQEKPGEQSRAGLKVVLLHHDNALAHSAIVALNFLKVLQWNWSPIRPAVQTSHYAIPSHYLPWRKNIADGDSQPLRCYHSLPAWDKCNARVPAEPVLLGLVWKDVASCLRRCLIRR